MLCEFYLSFLKSLEIHKITNLVVLNFIFFSNNRKLLASDWRVKCNYFKNSAWEQWNWILDFKIWSKKGLSSISFSINTYRCTHTLKSMYQNMSQFKENYSPKCIHHKYHLVCIWVSTKLFTWQGAVLICVFWETKYLLEKILSMGKNAIKFPFKIWETLKLPDRNGKKKR